MPKEWVAVLIATIVIEAVVLWLLKERRAKVYGASVVVNILTNVPLNVWLANEDAGWGTILAAELLVVVVEMLWYWIFVRDLRQAAIYSLLCNAISFLLGLLVDLITFFLPI